MKQEDIQQHIDSAQSYLAEELAKIRTGRASPALVEGITVEAYDGSDPMPLNELATVSVPEPQSVLITPWDKSIVPKIEEAIRDAGKGLSPVNDGENIRVPVPQLTEDRRKEYAKEVNQFVEQAKVKVRNIRQNAIKAVEEQQENGVISEDEMRRQKKLIEDQIQNANKDLEDMGKEKETEIMQV